ncbi:PSD1 and planctomycete cytochrome C domain-containing protein [Anatilimnocola floriformis]|uniref:PSD1 and planctomycete cytochrome C domain-containing protein n=1 Tax=Anatilimnocola floriformis TaxID=2948575 RepID=UPI0020C33197|nr:PSD1 and planctomycete cytochrome C domain-containing protein [Anatilimnocola floriformis]
MTLLRSIITFLLIVTPAAPLFAADAPDFERDVAPILVNHCLECHQPNKKSGGLNLVTAAGLLAGGEQGAAVVAGDPSKSLLLERITSGEMPPRESKESKPLSAEQIATLRTWINAGATWPKDRELGVHEKSVDLTKARQFWSFQPITRYPLPTSPDVRAATFLDHFVAEKLAANQLAISPPAAPRDLLRRVSLDLRGLPPTLIEQEEFLNDRAPDAYEQLLDRLLSDPAYGERTARPWLDLVRYADSNGYERDGSKPSVWKYRDYIIDAFNRDKPYDRFVLEQLAGDELADPTLETHIALGFHALGTWQDEVDPLELPQYRADEMDDMLRTTSQTFLGLTLGCARCHNHKFDPLTMVDYYSLAAILAPLKRPNQGRDDRDRPEGTPEQITAEKSRNAAITELQKQIDKLQREKPVDFARQVAQRQATQQELRAQTLDLPRIYRLFEDGSPLPTTHLLLSGRASNPGPVMQPRVPAVLTGQRPLFPQTSQPTSGRRLALTNWLIAHDNPLTSRVYVNRIWQQHFGRGLVATASDFGEKGARPTHPELLDSLAHWFQHDGQWSTKDLRRLILTSQTYRQSSAPREAAEGADPENQLLWRYPYRRLDVEAIRDSMLATAGNLNRQMHGPAVFLPIPASAIEAHTDKQSAWKADTEPKIDRRTVYGYVKRTLLVPMLETLDFCDTTQSTERRAITSVAPQALTLFNGEFTNRQAEQFADRLIREGGDDANQQITLAFRLAVGRDPTKQEMNSLKDFLQSDRPLREHLVQMCRVILNLNEFVYPN